MPTPIAFIQHPMWLLIKEDSRCGERVASWGAPSIPVYAERLARNLEAMEKHAWIRLNYDFSAMELALVQAEYPALAARIRAALQRGQLCLVNGTYSQAHLHTLSLEASARQLLEGTRLIRDLYGYAVRTYLMQEPGYTDQTPQLLAAVGLRYAYPGYFLSRLRANFHEPYTGTESFLAWRGLDGTEVPAMAPGLDLHIPGMPDLTEVELDPAETYVALDAFLAERAAADRTRKKGARMWAPWANLEGADGEALSQLNCACETALVQLDALAALLDEPVETRAYWHTWLGCQHHDAYWTGAPELREKCCGWLRDTMRAAVAQTRQLLAPRYPDGSDGLLLFAVYPRPHAGALDIAWPGAVPAALVDDAGERVPLQPVTGEGGETRVLLPYRCAGAGDVVLRAVAETAPAVHVESTVTSTAFQNAHYQVVIDADGSLCALQTASGQQLIGAGRRDAVLGIGKDLFTPRAEARIERGPVATIIRVAGAIRDMPVTRTAICCHDLPWFELRIACEFNESAFGDFYDDASKLTLRWLLDERVPLPVKDSLRLVQGIEAGAIPPDEPERAFYPVNWLDMHYDHAGVALINFGTLKHRRHDGELLTVLAWGSNTARFGNRCDAIDSDRLSCIDLRLNGTRAYRFAVYPHAGDWRRADVPHVAMSLLRPPVARPCALPVDTPGHAPLLALDGSLAPSALFRQDGHLVCRAYESMGSDEAFTIRRQGHPAAYRVCDIADQPSTARPWGIYHLHIG